MTLNQIGKRVFWLLIVFVVLAVWALMLDMRDAKAGCRVNCARVVVQEAIVATPFAVAVGIPYAQTVAGYSPVSYQYSPTPPAPNITVNVQLDRATIAAAMKDALGPSDQQNQQPAPLPSPPPIPSAEQPAPPQSRSAPAAPAPPGDAIQRCTVCHSPTGKPNAFARFNPLDPNMDCKLRLRAVQDIVTDRMPPPNDPLGGKLNGDEAGQIITKISKQ